MTYLNYVPVLKWRQGEYQALMRLRADKKNPVVPLIEITPPDFDFELQLPKKTIDEHLAEFAARLEKKWEGRPALLDTGLLSPDVRMDDGLHPLLWLMDQVRPRGGYLIPVTGLDRDAACQNAVRIANATDGRGVALRCSLEDAGDPAFADNVETLLEQLEIEIDALDIIVDLKSPNFQPIDGLAQLLAAILSGSTAFEAARSVTIVATSFPASMGEVTGPIQFLHRYEWLLYKALMPLLQPGQRRPGFGDYCIAAPDLAQGDMRLLKPSATVRYTTNDGWVVAKGPNVRDNGFEQYRTRCGSVTESGHYLGSGFSPGSEYIDQCRSGVAKTGNLTTWRWVGTNHHISKVVHDLASLHGL
jgi:hypothetical protein